jgi:hypothetical protein
MEPAPHVLDSSPEAGERTRIEIDVAEFDHACARRPDQAIALPPVAGVTDGTFGIVPDRELRLCHGQARSRLVGLSTMGSPGRNAGQDESCNANLDYP